MSGFLDKKIVTLNPWEKLKSFTDARIALGRAGCSLPTQALLQFQLEHAQARDAVHLPLDMAETYAQLKTKLEVCPQAPELFAADEPLLLTSEANDRGTYLQRPDLGRLLSLESAQKLSRYNGCYDLAICVVDGLSSQAIEKNAGAFLLSLFNRIKQDGSKLSLAPLSICSQGRVAIGDQVAELLNAKTVLVLIGERPGLMSPDSMGLYLTHNAKRGCHDAMRNCISNIRPAGLSYDEAASKAMYLIKESKRLGFSGVNLKERSEASGKREVEQKNFLTQI